MLSGLRRLDCQLNQWNLSFGQPLDVDSGHIRRRGVNHAFNQPLQLGTARARRHIGSDLHTYNMSVCSNNSDFNSRQVGDAGESVLDTRLHVVRMQVVQHEQACNQIVCQQAGDRAFIEQRHNAGQRGPVHLHDEPHELLRLVSRLRITDQRELLN